MSEVATRPSAPGLRVVAFVLVLLGASLVPQAILLTTSATAPLVLQWLAFPFALAFLAGGIGLWFFRRWARPIAMAVAAVATVALLYSLLRPAPGQSLFLAVLTLAAMLSVLFYLQRPHVRAALR